MFSPQKSLLQQNGITVEQKEFGQWVIARRRDTNLTRDELALLSKVPVKKIEGIESGRVKHPALIDRNALAAVFIGGSMRTYQNDGDYLDELRRIEAIGWTVAALDRDKRGRLTGRIIRRAP